MKHNLDEDTRRSSGFFLCKADDLEARPFNCLGIEQVGKDFGPVAEFVDFKAVDHFELFHEEFVEVLGVDVIQHAETLGQVAVKAEVGPLLHAALQDHVAQLHLLALSDVQLQELVTALLEVH